MRKLFTLLFAVIASVGTLFAWDYERVQIGDLYYNLDATNQTAEVTSQNSDYPFWSTNITTADIPSSVTYNAVTYSVTGIGDDALSNCSGLTSVTIPNSIASIGNYAFHYCSGLTSVTIPNSITSIGNYAFYNCSGLTSVTIPNSVTSIGDMAFSECTGLTSPVYNAHMFAYMPISYSGAYTIPDGIESITGGAFYNCHHLTSITIPNSVTSIGTRAFSYCSGLTSMTIPNSVTSIGNYAFSSCYNLTSITIPNSVTSIGDGAFSYCSGLTSMTIPNSVTSIGNYAFSSCYNLTSITIPNSVTSIGDGAFSIVGNIVYNGEATGSPWGARSMNGYIEDYLIYSDNSKTTLLACSSAAQGEIIISNSVISIGDDAFHGCRGLTSVTIPNSVTSIGTRAFHRCTGLTQIDVSNDNPNYCSVDGVLFDKTLTELIQYPIGNTRTEYTIPNSVTGIGGDAFQSIDLTSLTCEATTPPACGEYVFLEVNKTIPLYVPAESVELYKAADVWKEFTNIQAKSSNPEDNTFGKCGDNLTWKFDQQTGVLSITGSGAMYNFTEDNIPWANHIAAITSIELPDRLTSFGVNAFRNCNGVEAIQIPMSLTASGNDAFYGCTGIKEVHVYNLKGWCDVQFGNAYSNPLFYGQLYMQNDTTPTTTLRITADITDLGPALVGENTITAVEVEDIASYCSITMPDYFHPHEIYYHGELVRHLVIPEGVTSVQKHNFEQATCLWSVTFPTTMEAIGDSAFAGCVNIEALTVHAIEPPVIDSMTFGGIKRDIQISVPCESVDAYMAAPWWSEFTGYPGAIDMPADTVIIYNDESYRWHGLNIDSAGIYHDTIRYEVSGCDSIRYTLRLEVTERPEKTFTITIVSDDEQAGTVTGGGIFKMDSVVTLTATANDGYVFAKWSDGSTDNPYIFAAKEDVELVAYFLKDQAEEAEVTEPQVTPTDSSVVITWPVIEDAVVYTIEIKKDGELICTLLFNEMGQLINIVFAAPARQGENKRMPAATRTANGWQYTITGLDPNTEYTYIVKAQKADDTVIYEKSIDFVTDNAEAIGNVQRDDVQCTKVLRDGQIYILRGDKTYTVTGQKVK